METVRLFCIAALSVLYLLSAQTTGAQPARRPFPTLIGSEIWLGPQGLPAPFPSAVDFMDMFKPDAPWRDAAAHTQVFKLYGSFLVHATQAQVNDIVADLKRRHIAIAVEVGTMNVPNNPPSGCGGLGNVEGYGTVGLATRISRIIKNAGGKIDYIAMDEPLYYGHYFTHVAGKGTGCRTPVSEVIRLSVPTLKEYVEAFPDIVIGDTEPSVLVEKSPEWKKDVQEWVAGFQSAMGRPMAFMQLDIEWPAANGKQANGVKDALALYAYAQELMRQRLLGKIGIIYNGTSYDTTDAAWCENARNHLLFMERQYHIRPGQVVFQSWNANPTHVLPQSSRDTLTGLIQFYFLPRAR